MMAQFTPPDSVKENKNKLSVITINYNNRDGLLRTIKSVAGQTCRDFEYIVIDGGSTDGSVDIIKEYVDYIDYWVSEPDKGIYNAMNKGVRVAHGEFCQFLNSGDWYYDDNVIQQFYQYAKTDIILGKTAHVKNGHVCIGRSVKDVITFMTLIKSGINHQSSFIRRSLCEQFPYDEKYKICSDWKFWLESLILGNSSFSTVDDIIVYFDQEGISNVQLELNGRERNAIIKELGFPRRILDDYDNMSVEMYDLSKRMKKYHGFNRFIVGIDKILIRCYSIIKS